MMSMTDDGAGSPIASPLQQTPLSSQQVCTGAVVVMVCVVVVFVCMLRGGCTGLLGGSEWHTAKLTAYQL